MSELVRRLCQGKHPVEVSLRPEKTAAALKRRIEEYSFVHIKFTETRGGTELGVRLNKVDSSWETADFQRATGHIRLAGELKLDYVPVKCVADIDLSTLTGSGYLEVIQGGDMNDAEM